MPGLRDIIAGLQPEEPAVTRHLADMGQVNAGFLNKEFAKAALKKLAKESPKGLDWQRIKEGAAQGIEDIKSNVNNVKSNANSIMHQATTPSENLIDEVVTDYFRRFGR